MPLTSDAVEELNKLLGIFFEKIGRKERLRKQILKLMDECEAYLYPKIREWLQGAREQIIKDIRKRILRKRAEPEDLPAGYSLIYISGKGPAEIKKKSKPQIVIDYVDWETIEEKGKSVIKPAYLNIMEKSGNLARQHGRIEASFDVINPRSVEWAEKYSYELVTLVGKETKAGLRAIVTHGMKEGKTLTQIAKEIRSTGIGLNERQAKALLKYGDALKAKGITGKLWQEKWKKQFNRFQRDRSKMIARTEVSRSANEGYLDSLEGTRYEEVEISSAADACSACLDLAGQKFKRSKASGMLPVHPNCYDDKTEIYTNKGWMLFKDLHGDEEILSLNPNTFDLEWLPYITKISYYYEGKLYHFKNNWFSLRVTPDHNQIFGTRFDPEDRKRIKWRIGLIEDIVKRSEFILPRTANWRGKKLKYMNIADLRIETKLFCKLMGYYLSEGSVTQRYKDKGWEWYQIKISQNPQGLNKIFEDIKKLPVKLAKGKYSITCNDKRLAKYLLQFGHSGKKYIPEEIKELDSRLIKVFLDAFNFGDGSKRINNWHGNDKTFSSEEKVFFTSSQGMAGDLGELILKAGGYPSYYIERTEGKLHKFRNGIYKINNDLYRISWNKTKNAYFDKRGRKDFIKEIDYKGYVYDVELPRNHILWIKHDGKTCWSGNCRCHWIVVIPRKKKPKPRVLGKPKPVIPGFAPAKTIKEAERYGERVLIKPEGRISGVNFGRVSLDNANMINERLTGLINDYKIKPDFIGSSQAIRRAVKRVYPEMRFNPVSGRTFAEIVSLPNNEMAIAFNEKYFKTGGKALLERELGNCFATGFHKLKNIEHIVDHEYAHVLDNVKKLSLKSDFVKHYTFLKDRSLVKMAISGYAEADGLTESWAEIFALYRADKLPPLRKTLVEGLLK